jgi:hypothetical protein
MVRRLLRRWARANADRAIRSVAARVMMPNMIATSGVGMNSPVPA